MAKASSASPRAAGRDSRSWRASIVAVLGSAAAVLIVAAAGFDGGFTAPTIALSIAAAMLVVALQAVYELAKALATAEHDTVLDYFGGGLGPTAELRDERRRLLRAIKELDFDRELGKLSEADHAAISTKYRLRAIELARELDGDAALHPALAVELGRTPPVETGQDRTMDRTSDRDASRRSSPSESLTDEAESPAADSPRLRCGACEIDNDSDARFCKSCGRELTP